MSCRDQKLNCAKSVPFYIIRSILNILLIACARMARAPMARTCCKLLPRTLQINDTPL